MTIEKINQYLQTESIENGFLALEAKQIGGNYSIGGFIVFPIIINTSYQSWEEVRRRDEDSEVFSIYRLPASIQVKFKSGDVIGSIYFSNNEQNVQEMDMPAQKKCAYLLEVSEEDFQSNTSYKLSKDYLVIEERFYQDYIENYKKSSILWGGFYHEDDKEAEEPLKQIKTDITCLPNLNLPTPFHHDNAQRAIAQPYAFERFLKNYHLLELQYDSMVIDKVKSIGADMRGASRILKEYGKGEEVPRLIDVITKKFDILRMEYVINKVGIFRSTAVEIFYIYGKPDNNPLMVSKEDFDNPSKFEEVLDAGGFSHTVLKTKHNISKPEDYKKFLIKLTAYWIYRIRSSIAHSKLGEFLLSASNPDHQEFMIKFAEPLLQEVLIQCFTT